MNEKKQSSLRTLIEHDAHNFDEVVRVLGPHSDLPDELDGLYVLLHSAIDPVLADPASRRAGILYLACRKHLILGAASLFRLHSGQTFRETRAAVEAAAIARLIRADQKSFEVFMADDGLNPEHRKRARNWFRSPKMFPAGVPCIATLEQFWEGNSALSHVNKPTTDRHIDIAAGRFSFQDITAEYGRAELPLILLWLCGAHIAILIAADTVFEGVVSDLTSFRNERKYLFGRIERIRRQYREKFPIPPGFQG